MEAETTLESHRVYNGRVLNLRVDRVAIPGGGEAIREVVEFHGGVALVALDDAARVLLIRQYRYAIGGDLLELPAGKLEPDEPPAVCAARELEEETGYHAAHLEPVCRFYSTAGATDELLHVFLATGLTPGHPSLETDERIEVLPTPWDEAVAMVRDGRICDAKTIIGLLMVLAHRAEPGR